MSEEVDIAKGEEKVEVEETKETQPEFPTVAELKESGFSSKEIKKAEELGRVKVIEEEKKEEPKEEPKKEESKEETKEEDKKGEEEKKEGVQEVAEEEEEDTKEFNDNEKGLYQRYKTERRLRQQANEERDRSEREQIKLKAEYESYRNKLSEAKTTDEVIRDEDGNIIDPEEKPLTLKQWKALQAEEEQKKSQADQMMSERRKAVDIALSRQEENARVKYQDYDEVFKLAQEILEKYNTLFTGKTKKLIEMRAAEIFTNAARADQIGLEDYNPADMLYDLGKLHPEYGKPTKNELTKGEKVSGSDRNGNRGLTPDEMERIEKNASRRSSSASISGGGGRRVVSPEDITLEDLNRMSPTKYREMRRKYPDRVKEILNS